MMTRVFLVLAGTALMTPAAQAGMQICTQIGCADGLTISVDPTYQWQPGEYEFDFMLPDGLVQCRGNLPLKACGEASMVCTKPGVAIGESGCALPAASHGFSDIRIDGAPASVVVTVKRDGVAIVEQSIQPAYQTSQPNGPNCEPICHAASQSLNLR